MPLGLNSMSNYPSMSRCIVLLLASGLLASVEQCYEVNHGVNENNWINEPGLGGYEKDSLEEYENNKDKMWRRAMTFGSPNTLRLRFGRKLKVADESRFTNMYDMDTNIRMVKGTWEDDGNNAIDFIKYGFTKIKLPRSLFEDAERFTERLFGDEHYFPRPGLTPRMRKIRQIGAKMERDFMREEQVTGGDRAAGDPPGTYLPNDLNLADMYNNFGSHRLSDPNGPGDVLATKNNPQSMKLWLHFTEYHCMVRSAGKRKMNHDNKHGDERTKKGQRYGAAIAHSLGFWTDPGFWETFRRDMYSTLGSTRYEIEGMDIINWSQYVRDFHSGLVDYQTMWIPITNYECRPFVVCDLRTQKENHVHSNTRYTSAILPQYGHLTATQSIYDPNVTWYLFDPDHFKRGEAVAFHALLNTHASVAGVDSDKCDHPNTKRISHDVRGITLNVDMENKEPAVDFLLGLHRTNDAPVFETAEEAESWIDRHWQEMQERYTADSS